VSVETDTVKLFAEDIVFVTSDGIIDAQTDAPTLHDSYLESDRNEDTADEIRDRVVTDDELRDWILSADSLDDAGETLIEQSNERGGKDNLSTILFQDPALDETPTEGGLPIRKRELEEPIVDRETVLLPDE
jgi:serine/threonine protein phosphatase PrpC